MPFVQGIGYLPYLLGYNAAVVLKEDHRRIHLTYSIYGRAISSARLARRVHVTLLEVPKR